jgi:hypothetical protein
MSVFEFITNEDFRLCLERDYKELDLYLEAGAWKAAHVLSGSMVEALLIDYLASTEYATRTNCDPLKFDLATAIKVSRTEGVISERVEDLCIVIRSYRNLIHLGRSVRLGETVDSDSAAIAKSLVGLITREISATKIASYGLTADQIVAKVVRDPSGSAVMSHLIKRANEHERRRLLVEAIPKTLLSIGADNFDEVPDALKACFRVAFEAASPQTQKVVANEYVRILKEESAEVSTRPINPSIQAGRGAA